LIDELLPASVVAVEAYGDEQGALPPLYPEEEAVVARAVDKRRREFAVVRGCARRAMEKLGVPAQSVLRGERGAPRWPAGLIGSMTHCEDYCAAALARAGDLASLGIDAERHEPLPEDAGHVVLPSEAERIARLRERHPGVHWERILFSAKESVYKAWFPLTGAWLDFSEADITLHPDPGGRPHGTLRAELLVPGPRVGGRRLQAFDGRWAALDGLALTAVAVPHS
jgi:4'-phosphopantetheinyl transferase EntD